MYEKKFINSLICRQKNTQHLCEVQIKDESSSDTPIPVGNSVTDQPAKSNAAETETDKKSSQTQRIHLNDDGLTAFTNPLTNSFDVLNMLRNSSMTTNNLLNNKYSDEIQLIIEMQAKEHALRMDILRAQLDTAKLNRDIAEINKIILLRGLQNENE